MIITKLWKLCFTIKIAIIKSCSKYIKWKYEDKIKLCYYYLFVKHIARNRNIIFNFALCSHLQWPNHSYTRFHSLSQEEYEIIYNNRCGNEREMGYFSWNCSKRDYNFVSYVGLGEVCSMHRVVLETEPGYTSLCTRRWKELENIGERI